MHCVDPQGDKHETDSERVTANHDAKLMDDGQHRFYLVLKCSNRVAYVRSTSMGLMRIFMCFYVVCVRRGFCLHWQPVQVKPRN